MGQEHSTALKKAFEKLDTGHNGRLSLADILTIQAVGGLEHLVHNSPLLLFRFDQAGEGAINLKGFTKLLTYVKSKEKELKEKGLGTMRKKVWCPINRETASSEYDLSRDSSTPVITGQRPEDDEELTHETLEHVEEEVLAEEIIRDTGNHFDEIVATTEGRKRFVSWLFKLADTGRDGKLDVDELIVLLRALRHDGINPEDLSFNPEKLLKIVAKAQNSSKNGTTEDAQDKIFAAHLLKEYDVEKMGYLSPNEFDVLANLITRVYELRSESKESNINQNQLEGYRIKRKLGKGAMGEVRLGVELKSGHQKAIKIVPKGDMAHLSSLDTEIAAMMLLHHEHIVRLDRVLEDDTQVYFIMELCGGGNISDYLDGHPVPETLARYYFQQIVDGVLFCHSQGVAHRDLKLDNILLDNNANIKITDFGHAGIYKSGWDVFQTPLVGGLCHVAPEQILGTSYSGEKHDVWSLGIILFVLLSGHPPFMSKHPQQYLDDIQHVRYSMPSHFSKEAKHLISSMLVADSNKRPNVKAIASHIWLTKEQVDIPLLTSFTLAVPAGFWRRFSCTSESVCQVLKIIGIEPIYQSSTIQNVAEEHMEVRCHWPAKDIRFSFRVKTELSEGNQVLEFKLCSGASREFLSLMTTLKMAIAQKIRKNRQMEASISESSIRSSQTLSQHQHTNGNIPSGRLSDELIKEAEADDHGLKPQIISLQDLQQVEASLAAEVRKYDMESNDHASESTLHELGRSLSLARSKSKKDHHHHHNHKDGDIRESSHLHHKDSSHNLKDSNHHFKDSHAKDHSKDLPNLKESNHLRDSALNGMSKDRQVRNSSSSFLASQNKGSSSFKDSQVSASEKDSPSSSEESMDVPLKKDKRYSHSASVSTLDDVTGTRRSRSVPFSAFADDDGKDSKHSESHINSKKPSKHSLSSANATTLTDDESENDQPSTSRSSKHSKSDQNGAGAKRPKTPEIPIRVVSGSTYQPGLVMTQRAGLVGWGMVFSEPYPSTKKSRRPRKNPKRAPKKQHPISITASENSHMHNHHGKHNARDKHETLSSSSSDSTGTYSYESDTVSSFSSSASVSSGSSSSEEEYSARGRSRKPSVRQNGSTPTLQRASSKRRATKKSSPSRSNSRSRSTSRHSSPVRSPASLMSASSSSIARIKEPLPVPLLTPSSGPITRHPRDLKDVKDKDNHKDKDRINKEHKDKDSSSSKGDHKDKDKEARKDKDNHKDKDHHHKDKDSSANQTKEHTKESKTLKDYDHAKDHKEPKDLPLKESKEVSKSTHSKEVGNTSTVSPPSSNPHKTRSFRRSRRDLSASQSLPVSPLAKSPESSSDPSSSEDESEASRSHILKSSSHNEDLSEAADRVGPLPSDLQISQMTNASTMQPTPSEATAMRSSSHHGLLMQPPSPKSKGRQTSRPATPPILPVPSINTPSSPPPTTNKPSKSAPANQLQSKDHNSVSSPTSPKHSDHAHDDHHSDDDASSASTAPLDDHSPRRLTSNVSESNSSFHYSSGEEETQTLKNSHGIPVSSATSTESLHNLHPDHQSNGHSPRGLHTRTQSMTKKTQPHPAANAQSKSAYHSPDHSSSEEVSSDTPSFEDDQFDMNEKHPKSVHEDKAKKSNKHSKRSSVGKIELSESKKSATKKMETHRNYEDMEHLDGMVTPKSSFRSNIPSTSASSNNPERSHSQPLKKKTHSDSKDKSKSKMKRDKSEKSVKDKS